MHGGGIDVTGATVGKFRGFEKIPSTFKSRHVGLDCEREILWIFVTCIIYESSKPFLPTWDDDARVPRSPLHGLVGGVGDGEYVRRPFVDFPPLVLFYHVIPVDIHGLVGVDGHHHFADVGVNLAPFKPTVNKMEWKMEWNEWLFFNTVCTCKPFFKYRIITHSCSWVKQSKTQFRQKIRLIFPVFSPQVSLSYTQTI